MQLGLHGRGGGGFAGQKIKNGPACPVALHLYHRQQAHYRPARGFRTVYHKELQAQKSLQPGSAGSTCLRYIEIQSRMKLGQFEILAKGMGEKPEGWDGEVGEKYHVFGIGSLEQIGYVAVLKRLKIVYCPVFARL